MTLDSEVVDLVGFGFLHDVDLVCRIRNVNVANVKASISDRWALIDVVDAASVEGRRKSREISAILTGETRTTAVS